jgi:hypothetical protein
MNLVYCVGICFLIIIGAITAAGVKKYYELKEERKLIRQEELKENKKKVEIVDKDKDKDKDVKEDKLNITVCNDFENWVDINYDNCSYYGESGYPKKCSKGEINDTYIVTIDRKANQSFSNFDELAPTKGKYKGIPAYAACCECGGGIEGNNFKKWCETNLSPYCPERIINEDPHIFDVGVYNQIEIPSEIPTLPPITKQIPFKNPPPEFELPPTKPPIDVEVEMIKQKAASDILEAKTQARPYDNIVNKKVNGATNIGTSSFSTEAEAENICTNNTDCIGFLQHKFEGTYTPIKKNGFMDADIIDSSDHIFIKKK